MHTTIAVLICLALFSVRAKSVAVDEIQISSEPHNKLMVNPPLLSGSGLVHHIHKLNFVKQEADKDNPFYKNQENDKGNRIPTTGAPILNNFSNDFQSVKYV